MREVQSQILSVVLLECQFNEIGVKWMLSHLCRMSTKLVLDNGVDRKASIR